MDNLPEWKLTLCSPLYDTYSKSPTEMTAQVYSKMRELVEAHNRFTDDIVKALSEHEKDTSFDITAFKKYVTDTMNAYITSIDTQLKIIRDLVENHEKETVEQIREVIQEALNTGKLTITEQYDETTESLNFVIGGVV